jgi:hypothetical protein
MMTCYNKRFIYVRQMAQRVVCGHEIHTNDDSPDGSTCRDSTASYRSRSRHRQPLDMFLIGRFRSTGCRRSKPRRRAAAVCPCRRSKSAASLCRTRCTRCRRCCKCCCCPKPRRKKNYVLRLKITRPDCRSTCCYDYT